ncbi:MAG TPA: hypothetical protein VIH90_03170 [Candidatus Saccharimonadales bacterium]
MSIEGLSELQAVPLDDLYLATVTEEQVVRLTLDDETQLFAEVSPASGDDRLPKGYRESSLFTLIVNPPEGSEAEHKPFGEYPIIIASGTSPEYGEDQLGPSGLIHRGGLVRVYSPIKSISKELPIRRISAIHILEPQVLIAA